MGGIPSRLLGSGHNATEQDMFPIVMTSGPTAHLTKPGPDRMPTIGNPQAQQAQ